MQVERTDTLVPLTLAVNGQNGGQVGLATVVAIRDTVSGWYLDWSDMTFKASPTTKKGALAEIGNGFYYRNLDLTAVTNLNTSTRHLGLEYEVITAGKQAVQSEMLTLRASHYDIPSAILAKIIDGAITLQTVLARMNAYVRGLIQLDLTPAPDTDVEYYAEDGTTKLFENRKSSATRTPQ